MGLSLASLTSHTMSATEASYTVFYHGGFSGRAQPADLMLVDKGVTWKRGR